MAHGPLRRHHKSTQLPTCRAPTQWEGNQGTRAKWRPDVDTDSERAGQAGGWGQDTLSSWGVGSWVKDHTCAFLMVPVHHCQALSHHKPRPLDNTGMEVKGQLISSPTFNASGWYLVPPSAASSLALSHHLLAHLGRVGPWPHRMKDAMAAPLIFAPSVSSCPVRRGCSPGEVRAFEGTAGPAESSAGGPESETSGATQSVPPRGGVNWPAAP